MENSSRALVIAGAIVVAILIIAIAIFIFTGSSESVMNSSTQMNTQEIEAFNSQFISYSGLQTGSMIQGLVGKLIVNVGTYGSELEKLPKVSFKGKEKTETNELNDASDTKEYQDILTQIRAKIETSKKYNVEFSYSTSGVISEINITQKK